MGQSSVNCSNKTRNKKRIIDKIEIHNSMELMRLIDHCGTCMTELPRSTLPFATDK